MKKVLVVAKREFLATITSKGFLIGILLPPAIILIMSIFIPRQVTRTPPSVYGEIAVLDSSGELVA